MGVDISLHIEIRKQKEWHLMTFDIPLLKEDAYEDNSPIFETEVYNRRYHNFQDFLEDAPSHTRGKKDILSTELQAKLEEYDCFGTFMFDDLEKHCDNLEKLFISGISHAGIFTIKQQLDRIEQKLEKGSNYTPPAKNGNAPMKKLPLSSRCTKTSCGTMAAFSVSGIPSVPSPPWAATAGLTVQISGFFI